MDGGKARRESLAPTCYRDPAFFTLEAERIFRREWISLAHVSQLAKPGDYICRDLFEELLVVTRDMAGEIHVLSRVCLHRWAEIVSGEGNAKGFVCPFHAWGYGLDGQLLGAPVTRDEEGFEISRCRLPAFRSEIVDGFIFVNLDGEAEPLAPRAAPMSARFADYNLASMVSAGSLAYDCHYNWKILVETFMESYHHIGAHQETLEPSHPGRWSYAEKGTAAFGLLHTPAKDAQAPLVFPVIERLAPELRDRFIVTNLYPCHLVAYFPDLVFWFRTQPIAVDRCELETLILVPPETLERDDSKPLIAQALALADQINREDIAVNVSQQRGLASRRAQPGRLNALEGTIIEFADYVSRMTA